MKNPSQLPVHRELGHGLPCNCANPSCREPLVREILWIGTKPFCNELCMAEALEMVLR